MGKRKSSKARQPAALRVAAGSPPPQPPPKKLAPKLDKSFACPFCNHEKSVSAKLCVLTCWLRSRVSHAWRSNFDTELGSISCSKCKAKWDTKINALSDAIDIYSDWIDECERLKVAPA
jgi:transcription elongation factor Elf1